MLPFALALAALLPGASGDASPGATRPLVAPDVAVERLVAAHCLDCHAGPDAEAGLDLEGALPVRGVEPWDEVLERLRDGSMPPKKRPRPGPDELSGAISALEAHVARARAARPIDPGRVPLRRLSRHELASTLRAVFGVDVDVERLPVDGVGNGFDNQAGVLGASPLFVESWLAVAEDVALRAVPGSSEAGLTVRVLAGDDLTSDVDGSHRRGAHHLNRDAAVSARIATAARGEFRLTAVAYGQQAGPDPARMELRKDGRRLERFDVEAEAGAPGRYAVTIELDAGTHELGAAFVNDYYRPDDPDPALRGDRNLVVERLELAGPLDAGPTDFERRYLPGVSGRELESSIADLATRAWRRPPSDAVLAELAELARAAPTEAEGLRAVATAVVLSPRMLYLEEPHPAPGDVGRVHALDDWSLAARLAYFLWSEPPDEGLLGRAARGELSRPGVLGDEAERLFDDARSRALFERFVPQWLQIERLETIERDPGRFPDFHPPLRRAMLAETLAFVEAVARERRPVRALLDADFALVNARLAEHYGLAGVRGEHLRRVHLPAGRYAERAGLLGHASVLASTSHPTRTSPVLRGKWVLEALLGDPPPPPPPGVGVLPDAPAGGHGPSLRERLERHRADSGCAGCHARLDPLGFALENLDPVGAWRTADGEHAIDARGELPDGRVVEGPGGLRRMLARDPRFVRNLFESLCVYALGRGLTPADEPAVEVALRALPPEATFVDLIRQVVGLAAFRSARGEGSE